MTTYAARVAPVLRASAASLGFRVDLDSASWTNANAQ